jgi:hypothetical protein
MKGTMIEGYSVHQLRVYYRSTYRSFHQARAARELDERNLLVWRDQQIKLWPKYPGGYFGSRCAVWYAPST